jgi:hypothetical protein
MFTDLNLLVMAMAEPPPQKYLTRLISPENLPSIGLLFAGIVGIVVAVRTLKAIEQQAKDGTVAATAAKDGAKAALLNAQAVITAERPWLMVTHFNLANSAFSIHAVNHGRSPAKLIFVALSFRCVNILDHGDNFPQQPTYEDNQLANEVWIVEHQDLDILQFDVNQQLVNIGIVAFGELYSGERQHFIWGIVKYRSIGGEEYESRFCYRWMPFPMLRLSIADPPRTLDYNKHS